MLEKRLKVSVYWIEPHPRFIMQVEKLTRPKSPSESLYKYEKENIAGIAMKSLSEKYWKDIIW